MVGDKFLACYVRGAATGEEFRFLSLSLSCHGLTLPYEVRKAERHIRPEEPTDFVVPDLCPWLCIMVRTFLPSVDQVGTDIS